MKISVAMAVYNGELWLKEQINSILLQLAEEDELIISYDPSFDKTWEIITDYQKKNQNVKVIKNNNKHGVIGNFNNAIFQCTGDYIFLSDQDDIWDCNKIKKMIEKFEKIGTLVVVCNGNLIDESGDTISDVSLFELTNISTDPFRNILKGSYWGCCMAFSKKIMPVIWPIPDKYNMCHDLWIGVIGGLYGKIELVEEKLISHRIHNHNYTFKLSKKNIMYNRIYFVCLVTYRRCRNNKLVILEENTRK